MDGRKAAFRQMFGKDAHQLMPQSGSMYEEGTFETVSGEMFVALFLIYFFAHDVQVETRQMQKTRQELKTGSTF